MSDLISVLEQLEEYRRENVCAYRAGHYPEVHTCDCKYGGSIMMTAHPGSREQTGCPELRDIETALMHAIGLGYIDNIPGSRSVTTLRGDVDYFLKAAGVDSKPSDQ